MRETNERVIVAGVRKRRTQNKTDSGRFAQKSQRSVQESCPNNVRPGSRSDTQVACVPVKTEQVAAKTNARHRAGCKQRVASHMHQRRTALSREFRGKWIRV